MGIADKWQQLWKKMTDSHFLFDGKWTKPDMSGTKILKSSGAPQRMKSEWAKLEKTRRLLLLTALGVAITLILSINLVTFRVSVEAGEIAGEDIYYSGATTAYASEIRTAEARQAAAAQVEQVYVVDPAVAENLLADIDQYFAVVIKALDPAAMGIAELAAALPGNYSEDTLKAMLELSPENIVSLRDLFKNIVSTAYAAGITKDELPRARENMAAAIASSTMTGHTELFVKTMLEGMDLSHNKEYDALSTAAAVDKAMDDIGMAQVTVQSGEKLVSRGAMVTESQMEALQALGLHRDNSAVSAYLGLAALVVLCCVLLNYYLKLFHRPVYKKLNLIALLAVVILLVLLLSKLISLFTVENSNNFGQLVGYMLPTGAAAMLVSVLLSQDIAIFCVALFAIFTGVIMSGQVACVLVALSSGLAAVFCANRLSQRSQFIGASMGIAAANAGMIIGWGLIQSQSLSYIGISLIFGLANGLLCAILTMGTLPFFESGFGVTTVSRLLELSNSNHP
ncbi:MAG: hypothetical protein RR387_06530, partial [Clostridiales bacterium]